MSLRHAPAISVGLVAGLLFFVHGLFPYTHAWPLVWPLLGGIAAVLLAARRRHLDSFWGGVRTSLKAGAVAGGVFLITMTAAVFAMSFPQMEATSRALGGDGAAVITGGVVLGLAAVAALGMAAAALGGMLTFPVARRVRR